MATAHQAGDDILTAFGENVRRRRLHLGLTQLELAERIGTYQSHVAAIESGRLSVRLRNLAAWAAALETSPARLLEIKG